MSRDRATELTLLAMAGEPLTQADEQWLLDWLEEHAEVRKEILADSNMESLLQFVGERSDSEEQFIQATLSQVTAWKERADSAADSQSARSSTIYAPAATADLSAIDQEQISLPDRVLRRPMSRKRYSRGPMFATVACSLLLMVLIVAAYLELQRTDPSQERERLPVAEGQSIPQAPIQPVSFASLVKADGTVWRTPRKRGDRLAADRFELISGTAEIMFDKGTVARITGPAVVELINASEVLLSRGMLTARVPAPAIGFTVVTPVGRVVDLGTEFDVLVADSGATEAHVREGKVVVNPQRHGELPGKSLELTADHLDRAVMSVPEIAAPLVPVSVLASSRRGEFFGTISANGKTLEFNSPEDFQQYQEKINQQLRTSPAGFSEQWSIMMETSSSRSGASGSVSVQVQVQSNGSAGIANGQGNEAPEKGLDARDRLREELEQMRGQHEGNSQLQGMFDRMIQQLDGLE